MHAALSPVAPFTGCANDDAWHSAWPPHAPAGDDEWLRTTPQLDLADPRLHITAQKLTQARQSHAARAAAVQDFVRRMPFAASADGDRVTASEVLRRGRGDCHGKGVLFTALCRAAGLPARLLFVDLRPRCATGLPGRGRMPHAVAQVLVDGRWWSTDGYVIDPVLFARAKELQRASGADRGWGVVREASGFWDGRSDCLHLFRQDDVLRLFGPFHDAAGFHRSATRRFGGLHALRQALGVRLANHRIAHMRRGTPSGLPALP